MKKYIKALLIMVLLYIFSQSRASSNPKQSKVYRIWVIATAYCPCEKCCGSGSPGITKTGTNAYRAGVAVDPDIIPLGSHIDIPEYSRGPNNNGSWILCDDIGGSIKGKKIDVRFKTHSEALNWGRKRIQIRVHKK